MSKTISVVELGCPGHLIVASRCRWHRHTQIGDKFRVSTIGDYFPQRGGKRETLGAGDDSFFESMVFNTVGGAEGGTEDCGCRECDFMEIDCNRYPTAGKAQAGHEEMVAAYLARAQEPTP